MLKKITDFKSIRHLLDPLRMDYFFDSISEGYTTVEVYVNDSDNPTVALVIEETSFFFAGDADDEQVFHHVIDLFKTRLKEHKKEGSVWAKLFYTSDTWRELLAKRLNKLHPVTYERVLLQHDLEEVPSIVSAHDDLVFTEINQSIFEQNLKNTDVFSDEIKKFWGSVNTFLTDGIGYCAIKDDELVAWSTTRYHSKDKCSIGVRTISKYQRKGIATVACNLVLHKCKEENLITYWNSWKTNSPSVSIAKKNGFNEAFTYEVFLIKY